MLIKMKKIFYLFVLCIGLLKFSFATDLPKAKIYIYRPNNFFASSIGFKIYAEDKLIVRLKNNSYVVYECIPGNYTFSIDKKIDSRLKINVESGKTYYFKVNVNIGFWTSQPELILIQDTATAIAQIKNTKEYFPEIEFNTNQHPKFRIGLNLAFGGGFKKTAVYSTNNGNFSYISTGGGYGIGGKFGYEVSNHLDIAMDFNYQFSFLIPHLNNAENTFKRGYVSLTPSYIINVGDGEKMRFKIGVGYDYYFDNMLIIDGKNVPKDGFNDTWKYDKTSGWHASIINELNISDKFSLSFGIKYYYVKYKFKSSYLMKPDDDSGLKTPDGSGIDILIGYNYHF